MRYSFTCNDFPEMSRLQTSTGLTKMVKHQRQCFYCFTVLKEPFIKCDDCTDILVCIACFASGRQRGQHSNNHRYRIIRDDFNFIEDWKVRDELILVDKLEEFGASNWIEVARHLDKTPAACEKHYLNNYIENQVHPTLPRPPSPENLYRPLPITFKTGVNDPPRPVCGTAYHRDLAGYCAARGDFQTEVFQNAELDVASIEELDDDPLSEALSLTVVDIYNNKLRERFRRKRIVQEQGLIHMHRHLAARFRYDTTLSHRVCERLSPFAQILKFDEFNLLFEALHAHVELKRKIRQLQKYRHLGLCTFQAAQLYTRLQMQRDKRLKTLKQFSANLNSHVAVQIPIAAHPTVANSSAVIGANLPQARRAAPPLDIVAMPGYDKLDEGEKQLCSVSRLVPESYLDFKRILINECRNRSGIRLAQARTLIKIDVNKTRKIFDFLLEEKLIYPPAT